MLITHFILAVAFLSPVHFDALLAGNFGEPRPNHFHGGLDIKTQRQEGKAVYSIGDGFVCRVTKNLGGMGNAVYVRHPEGYTSVYGHLQRFAPAIEAIVKKHQYANQSTDVDITLQATDFPVAKGQLIALSGDTGASMGPHLHLEIHQTDTWNLMDPLDFIPDILNDSVAPKAHSIMAYPLTNQGLVCGQNSKQRFDFEGNVINDTITAWGKVGFAIYADDFMQGSENRYGIRYMTMLVDGKETFSSNVDNIPVECHKMVNVWGDYDYFSTSQQWFMRTFILPGNKLPFLKADANNGVVDFNQQREYLITFILKDFFGNESKYQFPVKATPQEIVPVERNDSIEFDMNNDNKAEMEGLSLVIPKGAMIDNAKVKPSARRVRKNYSPQFLMANKSVSLFKSASLSIKLENTVENTDKLYICALRRDKRNELEFDTDKIHFIEAKYENGWVRGDVLDIGNAFMIDCDETPPDITPVNLKAWENDAEITFNLKDSQSGVKYFKGYIDGEFVLFDYVKKTSHIICRLNETPVTPNGQERQLKLMAYDNLGNEAVYTTTIKY